MFLPLRALLVGALLAGVPVLPASAAETLLKPSEVLGKGGYVLFLRHGKTNAAERDTFPVDFDDCKTQRNLSAEGRVQAEAIGRHFRAYPKIIDKILVSPYCRTRETAKLAFGRFDAASELAYSFPDAPPDKARKAAWLNGQLGEVPPPGKVTVIVSHTTNLQDAARSWPSEEGDALVFKPEGHGRWNMVGKISAQEWQRP